MKVWIGSQGSTRDRGSWAFWDRERRQVWGPAVALTGGTAASGDRRPRAQKDGVTRVGRNPASQPLSIPRVSAKDILYPFSNNPKSIRFQSCVIRASLGGRFPPLSYFGRFKRWGRSSALRYSHNCATAQPVWCALTELVKGLWALPYISVLGLHRA